MPWLVRYRPHTKPVSTRPPWYWVCAYFCLFLYNIKWKSFNRIWNPATLIWTTQLTWLRTVHSGDWCLPSALRTLSGACQKWWWWMNDNWMMCTVYSVVFPHDLADARVCRCDCFAVHLLHERPSMCNQQALYHDQLSALSPHLRLFRASLHHSQSVNFVIFLSLLCVIVCLQ